MVYMRKAEERGKVNLGWLNSNHSFSFGHYYDVNHMGFSVLRVINDDVVQPGRGFDTHGHKDMEIVSYVVKGALKHKDSAGNEYQVPEGDIQVMSAGRGIMHSEYNASDTEEVNFLQIWIRCRFFGRFGFNTHRFFSRFGFDVSNFWQVCIRCKSKFGPI